MDLRTYNDLNDQEKGTQNLEKIALFTKDNHSRLLEIKKAIEQNTNRDVQLEILRTLKNIFYTMIIFGTGIFLAIYQLKEHLLN
jgi:hypothetical protein